MPSRPHPSSSHSSSKPGKDFLTDAEWAAISTTFHLTKRERAVASHLLEELSRKQIARRLKISVETVRVHIDGLFAKLEVEGRLGLALRFALLREALRTKPLLEGPPLSS